MTRTKRSTRKFNSRKQNNHRQKKTRDKKHRKHRKHGKISERNKSKRKSRKIFWGGAPSIEKIQELASFLSTCYILNLFTEDSFTTNVFTNVEKIINNIDIFYKTIRDDPAIMEHDKLARIIDNITPELNSLIFDEDRYYDFIKYLQSYISEPKLINFINHHNNTHVKNTPPLDQTRYNITQLLKRGNTIDYLYDSNHKYYRIIMKNVTIDNYNYNYYLTLENRIFKMQKKNNKFSLFGW